LDRIGLYLQDKHPIVDELQYARYAEEKGFESVWHAESRLARDAITPIAAILAVTKKIKAGTGVINTWTRNSGLVAATFLTLHEMSGGRALLGIGAWWDPLAWKVGIERKNPLKCMREYVETIRRLFKMETVTFEGEFVKLRDVRLDVVYGDEGPKNIPIYIGATGWKMMELSGEIADGVLLNYLVSPEYNKTAMEYLKKGASKAGRKIEDLDRPQLIVCSLDADEDKAIENARSLVTMYLGQQPHLMKASGVREDLIREVTSALGGWPAKPGGIEKAMQLVDDEVVQLLTVSGTAEYCRRQVREYVRTGCTCPLLYPLGDSVTQMIDAFSAGYM